MSINLFIGFKRFTEEDEQKPDSYVATVKKQLGVPRNIWLGMPLLLSNTKLGNHKITEPTMFYVSEFDNASVTLTSNTSNIPADGDEDGEIDMDKLEKMQVTISKDDFWKLQEPQIPPGMDPSMGMGI